jgi:valyl-tRNA synthetase
LQHAVRSKQIEIIPERFEKQYFNWVDNLLDWCLSRQIWYGHRVPAWYCRNAECRMQNAESRVIVSIDNITVCPVCGGSVEQDSDTLDTWFSAGMFSFTPLGGIDEETEDLKNYHPTSVLETGYDILTFWVVRMIMMTTYLRGEIPFKTVYLHGLVRDEQGRKMSKSLDNIIDPLDVSAKYGTDAVRLSLLLGSTPGNDTKLSDEKIGSFRNFTNKLWNIARFVEMTAKQEGKNLVKNAEVPNNKSLFDVWILNHLSSITNAYSSFLEIYNFSVAGDLLRDFTWNELADWYLEIAKIEGNKTELLNYILNIILKLWHPFMPFVTETIWQELYGKENLLMVEKWPNVEIYRDPKFIDDNFVKFDSYENDIFSQVDLVKKIIVKIRSLRADNGIEPVKKVKLIVKENVDNIFELVQNNLDVVKALARLEDVVFSGEKPASGVSFVEAGVEMYIDLAGAVDLEKERERIQKEIATVEPYVMSLEKKLSNTEFVNNAPAQVVEQEKNKLAEAKEKLKKLQEQRNLLSI